ncbi:MAG TPA: short chain dehydrogenase, partial [Minicystis sp.]|nr:short chain dehydrogenase [Minicystis sp.]
KVDLGDPKSIRALYQAVGKVDAVVSAAGDARFGELAKLTDDDFAYSLGNKLMGQVNLVRYGVDHVNDAGVFVLTSGVLARVPMKGAAAISPVNAGVEAFAMTAALELPRGLRVQVVSPPWVAETKKAFGMQVGDAPDAATVAKTYLRALAATPSGQTIPV